MKCSHEKTKHWKISHLIQTIYTCTYVIRKLLSVLNPNAIDIETCGNGSVLREAVIYPTKNEYLIPEDICGCTKNCTGRCSCKKRDIICTEYCHCEKKYN